MSSAISHLCSSPINYRTLYHRSQPLPFRQLHSKVVIVAKSSVGSSTGISHSQTKNSFSHCNSGSSKSPIKAVEGNSNGEVINEPVEQKIRASILHDFCLGIPFGGLILGGGLAGFIFTRNLTTLSTGVIFGGALLSLSTLSLKVWKQGKSCLPFILGQAVLAATLLWKNTQAYSQTKNIFPSAIFSVLSAAMLCFYSYVVLAGGNPPPKKKKSTVVVSS
ncbi:protein FATTY ACID EXPORT 1, chloroplastic-like [Impatiens glandulifera]|uniref:protein FATTY ACID EXPORT 1, chloroplastic-like n=1 Tax=Impatiens glandulifera TaxID=253017 RepID=UPI001FB17CF2|nr:protein FATTY ACID EXPORT 1, chloroplastic-like [Impatiens glandulifera]